MAQANGSSRGAENRDGAWATQHNWRRHPPAVGQAVIDGAACVTDPGASLDNGIPRRTAHARRHYEHCGRPGAFGRRLLRTVGCPHQYQQVTLSPPPKWVAPPVSSDGSNPNELRTPMAQALFHLFRTRVSQSSGGP